MKANYFEFEDQAEIKLSNGVVIEALSGETREALIERASEIVQREHAEELEVKDVAVSSVQRQSVKKLRERYEAASPVEKKIVETVLVSKGAMYVNEDEPELESESAGESESGSENEPGETPSRKVKPTYEEAVAAKEAVQKNVGSVVNFVPFRCATPELGEVTSVVIDRRVNKAYYRISGFDGLSYHKVVNDPRVTINAEETEKLKAEKAAEKAAKIKAKQDAAEELKAKKAAARAEKEAQREKARVEKEAAKAAEKAQQVEKRERIRAEKAAAREAEKAEKAAAREAEKAAKAAAREAEKAAKIAAKEAAAAEQAAEQEDEDLN